MEKRTLISRWTETSEIQTPFVCLYTRTRTEPMIKCPIIYSNLKLPENEP